MIFFSSLLSISYLGIMIILASLNSFIRFFECLLCVKHSSGALENLLNEAVKIPVLVELTF